jgi:uncharacterized protein (DUF2147 family)
VKRTLIITGLGGLLCCLWASAAVAQPSPVGVWQSIDDATGQPRAQIQITQTGELLTGKILASSAPTTPGEVQRCTLCTDDRKDKPLIGLEIIRNLRQQSGQPLWAEGEILDPDKGKTYRLHVQLLDGGKTLQVRGHIGPFYRTQLWKRLRD